MTGHEFNPMMAIRPRIGGARWRASRDPEASLALHVWCAWLVLACVIGFLVMVAPERSVSHNYRAACRNWFDGRPLYAQGVHGFLYFPHAAILFAPFSYLPPPLGDVLWRAASIGALSLAVWRLAASPPHQGRMKDGAAFALITCLALPPALASARNGQMNLMLTALTVLAFVDVGRQRWTTAAVWFCLGAALKPLMIVPMGVAFVAYQAVRWPLALGTLALVVAPFLTQHPAYVWQQYQACVSKLFLAGNPGWENPGSDLVGLISALGWAMELPLQTALRAVAAGVTVLLAAFAARRHQRACGAAAALGLTVCYLALFNPRMENNGYVVLGPTMGILACGAFMRRSRWMGCLMIIASLAIAGSYEITRGHNFWLCPLIGLFVWFSVIIDACRNQASEFALGSAPADVAS